MGLFDESRSEEVPKEAKEEPIVVKNGLRVGLREGEAKAVVTAGVSVDFPLVVENVGNRNEVVVFKVDLVAGSDVSEPSDWIVMVYGVETKVWDLTFTGVSEKEMKLAKGAVKEVDLSVTAPRGAHYGDRLNVIVTLTSQEDPAVSDSITLSTGTKQAVMAVKTSIGYERAVADSIASRAKSGDVGVYSILSPTTMRGYVFVEVMNAEKLQQMVKGIRRARGLVQGDTSVNEIDHFLEPKPLVSGIMEGNIVELISGPFKGEKARVMHIDEAKEEITVELFEAMVPIPVTIRGDNVRVLEKETR
ncbi:MAG: transcription elongation factor Spt5 [Candidatus Thermoplasmatota archaeon]|nr:transcription elongation factor Spt5 [Candidatus Thermoplasmatota archaeon]